MQRRRALLLVVFAVAAAALAATAATAATIQPPAGIAKAGKIVYCTDATYPPEEFFQGSKMVGSDIDIGTAIAKLMGVKAQFKNTGFDGIIAALLAKKCDAIISGMTDTKTRRKQVNFADYLNIGMSLMVDKGNPKHISTLASLSGKTVAAEVGTTEKDVLTAQNKIFAKKGKKPITIKIFAKDTDAAAALFTGKVDAYFADSPPVAYYVLKSKGKFEVAGPQIQAAPIGIATRKGDPLGAAARKAIAKLYATGQMHKILVKWKMTAFALKK